MAGLTRPAGRPLVVRRIELHLTLEKFTRVSPFSTVSACIFRSYIPNTYFFNLLLIFHHIFGITPQYFRVSILAINY